MKTHTAPDDLPEVCYAVVSEAPGKRIGLINRGDLGYYPSDMDIEAGDLAEVHRRVERLNLRLGVTPAQASRMLAGSMFGWDTPAALLTPEEFATKCADRVEGA